MVTTISKQRLASLGCVFGLDCSHYQANIDWSKANAVGIQFAFVKITEGTVYNETNIYNVKARVIDAQQNNIKIGYYHFARPGAINAPEDDAKAEVQNVLNHLALLPTANLPLVLDVEAYASSDVWTNNIDGMNRYITAFIADLQAQNINVIIYSYKSFIDSNTTHGFGSYPLWVAAYIDNPEIGLPAIPIGWSNWNIWQFTEQGQIDGYAGNIDLNIMKNSYYNLF